MKEIDIVYSNPIRIDENTLQVDKTCKVILTKEFVLNNRDHHQTQLNWFNNLIDKVKVLF